MRDVVDYPSGGQPVFVPAALDNVTVIEGQRSTLLCRVYGDVSTRLQVSRYLCACLSVCLSQCRLVAIRAYSVFYCLHDGRWSVWWLDADLLCCFHTNSSVVISHPDFHVLHFHVLLVWFAIFTSCMFSTLSMRVHYATVYVLQLHWQFHRTTLISSSKPADDCQQLYSQFRLPESRVLRCGLMPPLL